MKYKRYKHSRKGLAELFFAYKDKCEFIKDLLAQKEDNKECKHKLGDKEEHDNLGTYHIAGDICVKCGKHIMDWDNPTPSPLEIEEIEEIKVNKLSYASYNQWANIMNKINSLISNQKKLYQLIKEKNL